MENEDLKMENEGAYSVDTIRESDGADVQVLEEASLAKPMENLQGLKRPLVDSASEMEQGLKRSREDLGPSFVDTASATTDAAFGPCVDPYSTSVTAAAPSDTGALLFPIHRDRIGYFRGSNIKRDKRPIEESASYKAAVAAGVHVEVIGRKWIGRSKENLKGGHSFGPLAPRVKKGLGPSAITRRWHNLGC